MFFIGIDLAWSDRNKTGIAVLKADKSKAELISADIVSSDDGITAYVKNAVGNDEAFMAIDSPLIVPNKTGRRLAEKLVGDMFRKYDAGAHPSNRTRLAQWTGKIRGEEITKLLVKAGFKHSPYIKRYEKSRKLFEVYPHPSMVVLFKLDKILRYKAKPKRDYNFRWKEFIRYQDYLKKLKNSKPALVLPNEIVNKNVRKLKGIRLKNYEDMLDAIFCAYIAYYSWAKPDKCEVLGDMKRGYILTPVFRNINKQK